MPGKTRTTATPAKAAPKKATTRRAAVIPYDLPPEPMAPVGKYTLGAGRRGDLGFHDVELPSGATCQARRPGVAGLISAGVLDSFDELTALVQTNHIAPQDPKKSVAATRKVTPEDTEAAAKEFIRDPKKLLAALHMIDKLLNYVILQPSVWIGYQLEGESDADFAKRSAKAVQDQSFDLREMDLGDKTFLMNWAMGGMAELKTFRSELAGLMGPLESEPNVSVPAKRAPRRRG